MHTVLVQINACAVLVSTLMCAEVELFSCFSCVVCSQQKATLHWSPLQPARAFGQSLSPPEVNTNLRITQPSL